MGTYNDPTGDRTGTAADSTVGTQFRTDYYQKKALIELKKEQYFSPLADVISMPKHMGKKIKRYHYLPVLDNANINDQGIDADAATTNQRTSIPVTTSDGAIPVGSPFYSHSVGTIRYITGEGVSQAAAAAAAITLFIAWCEEAVAGGGLGLTAVGGTDDLKFFDLINETDGLAYVLGYRFPDLDDAADSAALIVLGDALGVMEAGNLYGSSKDVGTITDKMPTLSESGGKVNRIGMKRVDLEGTIEKYGIYYDYTKESMDFDTDAELDMHCTRELLNAGNEITEDLLQIDLLNSAGVVRYGGDATSSATITGENGSTPSIITWEDLMRLEIDLDNNRCPKQTKVITGSRMIDTRVINGARIMYIGSELVPTIKKMQDSFSNQAFIGVEHYAHAGDAQGNPNTINGEIGTVGGFRIVVVPEMMHWSGAGAAGTRGAAVTTNDGYRETGGYYNVYPMLVVGDASFTTIGFQTDGKTTKFKIKNVKPESDISYSADDPFGEMGFSSLKFYYGYMVLRPERIALCKVAAEW